MSLRVNIPFRTFAVGSLVGLQPLNFISVQAGRTLGRMRSLSDLYGPRTLLTMMLCALVALLPALIRKRPQWIGLKRTVPASSAVL